MTNTEITPELLRSVATWLRDNAVGALPGKPMAAEFLDGAADDLEREQADEKRIDEYAWVIFDQVHGYGSWDALSDKERGDYRSAARAVLDKLRIDSYTSPCDGKCGDSSPHNGHLTPEGRRHFLGEPRTWKDLRDVPGDVKVVRSPNGIEWHRTPSGGWALDASTWTPGRESSPFTEVIADA